MNENELHEMAAKTRLAYKEELAKRKEGLLSTDPDHMFEMGFIMAIKLVEASTKKQVRRVK